MKTQSIKYFDRKCREYIGDDTCLFDDLQPILKKQQQLEGMERHYLGSYENGTGNTLVALGGVHGNEPASILALNSVLEELEKNQIPFQGKLVALVGNLKALEIRKRFVDEDFNRIWHKERLEAIQNGSRETNEERELGEFLEELHLWFDKDHDHVSFLDLHTYSSKGCPFACVPDGQDDCPLVLEIDAPLIRGLGDRLKGTFVEYVTTRGYKALGFEAGIHLSRESVERHACAIWITLSANGNIPKDLPIVEESHEILKRASVEMPHHLDVIYRHPIRREDEFQMEIGFKNFDRVSKGQPIAKDRNGMVFAPHSGRILMPLYQHQGNDGFFIVKDF